MYTYKHQHTHTNINTTQTHKTFLLSDYNDHDVTEKV